jgi:hypothetical protein
VKRSIFEKYLGKDVKVYLHKKGQFKISDPPEQGILMRSTCFGEKNLYYCASCFGKNIRFRCSYVLKVCNVSNETSCTGGTVTYGEKRNARVPVEALRMVEEHPIEISTDEMFLMKFISVEKGKVKGYGDTCALCDLSGTNACSLVSTSFLCGDHDRKDGKSGYFRFTMIKPGTDIGLIERLWEMQNDRRQKESTQQEGG